MRYEMQQPNGSYVTIDTISESASAYTKEDFEANPGLKGILKADIYISWDYDSHHWPRSIENKTLYWDNKGLYTYAKQKEPFYYWKPQNIEEDYDNWKKDKTGYRIPLNEPRKLKKVVFI